MTDDTHDDKETAARQADRRKQAFLIACAVAAVALIGVGIAALASSGRRSASPALSQAELDVLTASAGRVLEEKAPGFSRNVAVTAETTGSIYAISHGGSSPLKWSKGQEVEIAALCMGTGRVTVRWRAPGGVTGELPVDCGEGATIARERFTPLADGQVIEFIPVADDEALGRAGLAVNIIEFR